MWYEIYVYEVGEGWVLDLRTNSSELAESRKAQVLSLYAEEDVDLNW